MRGLGVLWIASVLLGGLMLPGGILEPSSRSRAAAAGLAAVDLPQNAMPVRGTAMGGKDIKTGHLILTARIYADARPGHIGTVVRIQLRGATAPGVVVGMPLEEALSILVRGGWTLVRSVAAGQLHGSGSSMKYWFKRRR